MAIKKSSYIVTFILLSAILLFAARFNNEDKIIGVWLVGNGKAKVKIEKEGEKYFGKIVWLKNPNEADGSPKVDKNNPDAKLRKQPLIGLTLIKDFEYDGENEWKNGSIYDPENGNTYSCKITLKNPNSIEVRGYLGLSIFGRTDVWQRQKE